MDQLRKSIAAFWWVRNQVHQKIDCIVYTLWQHPGLLPLLHTPDAVVQKLCSGSSLMTPGLTRGPPFPSKATKGSVVAIAALEKPSVPMVVGICEIDVACLEKAQGVKGQAVSSEHWAGDELWAWSLSNQPGQSPPDEIRGWDLTDGPSEVELPQALEKVSLDVNSKEISVPVLTTQGMIVRGRHLADFRTGRCILARI